MNLPLNTFSRSSLLSALVIMGPRLLFNGAHAQLLGCDALDCPPDTANYLESSCVLGDVLYNNIGTTNFTSAIDPKPLTWTVGVSSIPDPTNSTQQIWSRGFYLGTPPDLDMSQINSFIGCALFFEGISSSLRFPGTDLGTSTGTCDDALSASCVSDILAQATSSSLVESAGDICENLQAALRKNAPQTCKVARNGSWGTIVAKNITGSTAPLPAKVGSCNPTTAVDYSVSYVESYNTTIEPFINLINPFAGGITPVLSVFFPINAGAGNGTIIDGQAMDSLKGPEAHLSCLKIITLQEKPPVLQGASRRVFAQYQRVMSTALLTCLLATLNS